MTPCDDFRPQMLDHLYGLLDGPKAAALEAHLRDCAACATTRAESTRAQSLIARAARSEFPQIKFEVPTATPKSSPAARSVAPKEAARTKNDPAPVLVFERTVQRRRSVRAAAVLAWGVAAAVLLAIPGTVVPVLSTLNHAELARRSGDERLAVAVAANDAAETAGDARRKQLGEVEVKLMAAKQVQEGLLTKWLAEEKAAIQLQAARKVTVDVTRPASVQPGAPNEFLLVLNERGLDPGTRLMAEVRDQTDAVLFSQRLNPDQRETRHILRLPAETWTKVTPHSELFLVVTTEDSKTRVKTELEKIRLLGPVYATLLATDRASYRPGDTVFFRSVTLDRVSFQPPSHEQHLLYELHHAHQPAVLARQTGGTDLVRVSEGQVQPVLGPDGKPVRGVGCGSLALPADLQDGDYTLLVRELPHPAGYPSVMQAPAVRTFRVRSGAVDVYTKTVGFSAASFRPGGIVEGWAEVKFQGQPVAGAEVRAALLADQMQFAEITFPPTGADGRTKFRFLPLPPTLERGDVRLRATFKVRGAEGTVREESVVERVPVVGRQVIVEFFPEGGTLVAGVPSRVYVRATTPAGQPVDVRGTITDGRTELAKVETVTDAQEPGANRGLGWFTFTPAYGTPVWLRLESPAGVDTPVLNNVFPAGPAVAGVPVTSQGVRAGFAVPPAVADGVVISVENPVTAPGEPFRITLQSAGRPRKLVVGAYTRGRLSDTKHVTTEPGRPTLLELMGGQDPRGGVVRVTVFEEPTGLAKLGPESWPDLKPVAERLVFRTPGERLQLKVEAADSATHAPAPAFAPKSAIELNIGATDEKDRPAAAILWAAAVNTGVAPGKGDRLLTTQFLLGGEVSAPDAMEYADFLLTDHPKARECLDLVLATQGWRRFLEQGVTSHENPRAASVSDRLRFLVNNGQFPVPPEGAGVRERRKLTEAYGPRYEAATRAVAAARAERDAATDTSADDHVRDLERAAREAYCEAREADEHARAAQEPVARLRGTGWFGVAGFGMLAVLLGGLALGRPRTRLPYGIGTVGSLGLVAFLVFALNSAERTQASTHAPGTGAASCPECRKALEKGTSSTGPDLGKTVSKPNVRMGPMQKTGDKTDPGTTVAGATPDKTVPPKSIRPMFSFRPDGTEGWPLPDRRKGSADLNVEKVAGADAHGPAAMRTQMSANETAAANARLRADEMQKAREWAQERLRMATEPLDELMKLNYPLAEKPGPGKVTNPAVKRGDGLANDLAAADEVKAALVTLTPLIVREYAAPRPGSTDAASESPDTILWQPVIVLPGDGKTTLPFRLGSSPGGYQVIVAGHTLDGRIGATKELIKVGP